MVHFQIKKSSFQKQSLMGLMVKMGYELTIELLN
jgi:hypothetical protein